MDLQEYSGLKSKVHKLISALDKSEINENLNFEEIIQELEHFELSIEQHNNDLENRTALLEKEQKKYSNLYNNSPAANLTLDQNLRIIAIGSTAAKIFGLPKELLVGQDFATLVDPDSLEKLTKALDNLETNVSIDNLGLRLIDASGRHFYTTISVEKFLDENNLACFRLSIIEQTDKINIQNKLLESNSSFNSLIHLISLSYFRIDTNSIISYANQNFLDFFELDIKDVAGKHLQDVLPTTLYINLLRENDLCIKTNEPVNSIEALTHDTSDRKRYMQVIRSPICNPEGNVTGLHIYMWDIAEKSQTDILLRNSEYKYRKLVEDSSDLFVISNGEGDFKFVGENCKRITGYTVSEALKMNICDYIHQDDLEGIRFTYKRSFEIPGATQITNCRIKHKNGKWVWFELVLTNMTYDNIINGIITNIRDITYRIEAQRTVMEMESRYSQLFNFLPDGIMLIDPETHLMVEFNQEAHKQLGYTKNEFSKLAISDYEAIDSYDATKQKIQKILRNGEDEFETLHLHKDGSLIPTLVKAKSVNIDNKQYILTMFRDLTAFQSRISEKEESKFKFETLVDNVFDGIYLLVGRHYIYVNQSFCEITGYAAEEITSSDFDLLQLITPDYRQFVENRLANRLKNLPEDNKYELQIITKSGQIKSIEITNERVVHNGKDAIIGIVRDISDRRQLENTIISDKEMAQRSADIANNILNNLGHELRTPLNGILGFTKLLKADVSDEDQLEMIQMIEISGERLKKTLSALLVLTELDSLKYDIVLEPCELNTFVSMYDKTTIDYVQEKPIDFELNLTDFAIEISTDEYLLHQAIYELIDNAYKFTEQGAIKLTVGTILAYDSQMAFIEIADSGVGIENDKIVQIFEPFRQGSEGIQRRHEGMGLGLTIVKKIIDKLNGSIQVESEVDIGTKIRMLFEHKL